MITEEQKRFLKAFGGNLVKLRKMKNMSQVQLSSDAEIDLSTLSRIERGLMNISIINVYKISKALDVSNKTLFDFD